MSAPALLVHSGGFTSRQWKLLRSVLERERTVAAPDLIGYGTERYPVGTPFHFRQDVERLAGLLATFDEPAHLVGHSYGGMLVLELAVAHPERVRSLAVYEPVAFGALDPVEDARTIATVRSLPAYQPDEHGVDERWLAFFVDWWNGDGAWARLPAASQAAFREAGWKLSQEVTSLVTDMTPCERYATIQAPTLVLAGDRTQPVERLVVERLVHALPRAALQLLAGAGHMGPLTHASAVNELVISHLATH